MTTETEPSSETTTAVVNSEQQDSSPSTAVLNHETKSDAGSVTPLPIAECLLAFSKDARYIQDCKTLVQKVMQNCILPFFVRPSSNSRPDEEHALVEPTAEFLSAVLYTLLVLARTNKTLGMQVCGLEYPSSSQKRLVLGALASALSMWAIRFTAHRQSQQSSNRSSESLTGIQRRQYFEQQRREMMRRAREGREPTSSNSTAHNSHIRSTTASPTTVSESWRSSMSNIIQSVANALSTDILSSEGPHGIEDQGLTIQPNNVVAGNDDSSEQNASARLTSVVKWIFKLHFAFYCLNGKYPSFTHRFFYQMSPISSSNNTALVRKPEGIRIIGLLIVAQAAGKFLRYMSNRITHTFVDMNMRRTMSSSEEFTSSESTQHTKKPCFPFDGIQSSVVVPVSPIHNTIAVCSICQEPRLHPACPVKCGHVFCWKCLHQWVTSNVAACPLCRAECTQKDIMALHNYYPSQRASPR